MHKRRSVFTHIQSIRTFQEAQKFLYSHQASNQQFLKVKGEEWLEGAKQWLLLNDNPQEGFPAIHIAGTSGKGSVSYVISNILKEAGHIVGTHVSPHVYDVRERMLLNLQYISENEFVERVRYLMPLINEMDKQQSGHPIYFEIMFAFAMRLFSDKKVEYGIVETGIGGRFDMTNTLRSDKLAVITRLGLDHTEILGNTMKDIAWQKGGIIPFNGRALALEPLEVASKKVLESIASERGAELTFINPMERLGNIRQTIEGLYFDYHSDEGLLKDLKMPLIGAFQAENAIMAIEAASLVAKRDGLELNETHIRQGLEQLFIPARTELREIDGHTVLIDGAHNPQKIRALFDSINSMQLEQKPLVVFGAKTGKDFESSIAVVGEAAEKIYPSRFFMQHRNHLGRYSEESEKIAHAFTSQGYESARGFQTPKDALKAAMSEAKPGQPIIVTGSLYMIGELHETLIKTA